MNVVPILTVTVVQQILSFLKAGEVGQRVEARQFGFVTCHDFGEPSPVVIGDRQHVVSDSILRIGDQCIGDR